MGVTEAGLMTTRSEYERDVIVGATGFNASAGSIEAIGIPGVGGKSPVDSWTYERRLQEPARPGDAGLGFS